MADQTTLEEQLGGARVATEERSDTAALLGQVMFLVAVALGFTALGTWIGRELTDGAALGCFFGGFGMLMVANFVDRLRYGIVGITWLYAIALLLGLGIGPAINQLLTVDPDVVTQAAALTALTVVGSAALGFALSKDLKAWMRPLTYAIFAAVGVSIVLLVIGTAMPPLLSAVILVVSAALIVVYFNYLRKHATEADAVMLATGIFVAIINIFLSLLNLLSE